MQQRFHSIPRKVHAVAHNDRTSDSFERVPPRAAESDRRVTGEKGGRAGHNGSIFRVPTALRRGGDTTDAAAGSAVRKRPRRGRGAGRGREGGGGIGVGGGVRREGHVAKRAERK